MWDKIISKQMEAHMAQKNAYVVLDTETSIRDGLVFDFGWTTITSKGKVLG